jgi:hypothetical protein
VRRFLPIHDQIANLFSRRPNQDTATKFHTPRSQAFATWVEITGVANGGLIALLDDRQGAPARLRQSIHDKLTASSADMASTKRPEYNAGA